MQKISSNQIFWLTIVIILPTLTITLPEYIAQTAGQMGWLSIIITGVSIGLLHYIILTLSFKFSNHNLITDSKKALGSIASMIITLPYLFLIVTSTLLILTEIIDLMKLIMPIANTSIFGVMIGLLAAYLTFMGVENIARISELAAIGGLIIIIFFFSTLIFKPEFIDTARLKPIIFNPKLIGKGSLISIFWFIEPLLIFLFFKPFFKNPGKGIKSSLAGILFSSFIFTLLYLDTIAVFGIDLASNLTTPFFNLARLPLRGTEIFLFIIWLINNIVKLGIFFFTQVKTINTLFKTKNYKNLIVPALIFNASISIFVLEFSTIEGIRYITVGFLIFIVLPLLLILSITYLIVGTGK